jgi:hypothetical protein
LILADEQTELALQDALDSLSRKKISWDKFKEKVKDPLSASRLNASNKERTLLHLAVLDNQLEVIQALNEDRALKSKKDAFGLNPVDIARFLNRKEALHLLEASPDYQPFPSTPSLPHFEYLAAPIFETKEDFERILANVAKAKEEDKIPPEKIWMGIFFDKELRKGLHPPIAIRHIDQEVGWGVFSEKKIPTCSYVGEYTGIIQQRSPRRLKNKNYCLRYPVWEAKKHFTLDAEDKGNFTRFINHSSKPNLGLQSVYWRGIVRMIFIALKDIPEGAQLSFDYGSIFWKNHSQTPKALHDL